MRLWQIMLIIPMSTVICERGFSIQNTIKDMRHTCLGIKTLDYLMRIAINGPKEEELDWMRVYDIWATKM